MRTPSNFSRRTLRTRLLPPGWFRISEDSNGCLRKTGAAGANLWRRTAIDGAELVTVCKALLRPPLRFRPGRPRRGYTAYSGLPRTLQHPATLNKSDRLCHNANKRIMDDSTKMTDILGDIHTIRCRQADNAFCSPLRTASHGSSATATWGRSSSFRITATLPASSPMPWSTSSKLTCGSLKLNTSSEKPKRMNFASRRNHHDHSSNHA